MNLIVRRSSVIACCVLCLGTWTLCGNASAHTLEEGFSEMQTTLRQRQAERNKRAAEERQARVLRDRAFLALMDAMTRKQFAVTVAADQARELAQIKATFLYSGCRRDTLGSDGVRHVVFCYFKGPAPDYSNLSILTEIGPSGSLESKFSIFPPNMGIHSTEAYSTEELIRKSLQTEARLSRSVKGSFSHERFSVQVTLTPQISK